MAFLRDDLRSAVRGIAAGLIAGAALSGTVVTLLYQVKPWDPATFVVIATLIASVALGACIVPARRALRGDPATALRAE